jgi:adenylate cyclase
MATLRFDQTNGTFSFRLARGARLIVGRAPSSDIVIADPSVSRRHAELIAEGTSESTTFSIRDLESANGTLVNGVKSVSSFLKVGDVVTFGAVPFRAFADESHARAPDEAPAGVAIRALTVPISQANERDGKTLARLLGLATGLGGDVALEGLLDGVAELAFDHVDADRVSLLLSGSEGLVPAAGRSKVGAQIPTVPRAIADRAIAERVAIITESAMDDARFQSGSVKLQQVRGALCVPLFAPGGEILGVLYADTITRPVAFSEDEARALQAFAGLAAVVIGRARSTEEARRSQAIRESFERFFAPSVAAAIANSPERASLGGARLPVAVLFGDIRGFTRLAESANPEELAGILGEYFAGMVDAVFDHQGTLDKFTGDGLMAVWGAPLPQDDAADRALGAARAMRKRAPPPQRGTAGTKQAAHRGGLRTQLRDRVRREHRQRAATGVHRGRRRGEPRGAALRAGGAGRGPGRRRSRKPAHGAARARAHSTARDPRARRGVRAFRLAP